MNKQPAVTDATREAFVIAFCEFYQNRPLEKITVKEIAARAGYSRATFYNYFPDPYQLLEYLEERFIDTVVQNIASKWSKDHGLNGFSEYFVQMVQQQEFYTQVLLGNPHNAQLIERLKLRMLPLLQEALAIDAADTRRLYVLQMYISAMMALLGRWLQDGRRMPVAELAELVNAVLKEGFLPQLMANRAC